MNAMQQLAEESKSREVTWEEVREAVTAICEEQGEWCGGPIPVPGLRLQMAKGYTFAEGFQNHVLGDELYNGRPIVRACRDRDDSDGLESVYRVRNSWFSWAKNATVLVYEVLGRVEHCLLQENTPGNRLTFAINCLVATDAWSMKAEARAMQRLSELIEEKHFRQYFLSGSFLETSPRSNVTYMFRKLKPTVAMSCKPDGVKILAALCLHPIGWYEASYAGCMVPTDDVISHLLLMRSDEWAFWKNANHHPVWRAESGI